MTTLVADLVASVRGRARRAWHHLRFRWNRAPIVVVGNQKSGTSAVAHLLADCCGLSRTVDTPVVWERVRQLERGELDLRELARRAPEQFMTDLIKEPHLTFVFEDVRRLFPAASFVFVVRDPRDNIRSILDRLDISGERRTIEADRDLPPGWEPVLYHGGRRSNRVRHVRSLARRWRDAASIYLHAASEVDDVHLVRYEDFMQDRERNIQDLARRLGREPRHSISDRVDVQFQPRGSHRGVDWETFFSADNLAVIEEVCGPEMERLDYGAADERNRG